MRYQFSSFQQRYLNIFLKTVSISLMLILWYRVDFLTGCLCGFSFFLPLPFLKEIQFEKGQCFFYFKHDVRSMDIQAIVYLGLGWLVISNQGRYFIFSDALPRELMHDLIWHMRQMIRR